MSRLRNFPVIAGMDPTGICQHNDNEGGGVGRVSKEYSSRQSSSNLCSRVRRMRRVDKLKSAGCMSDTNCDDGFSNVVRFKKVMVWKGRDGDLELLLGLADRDETANLWM